MKNYGVVEKIGNIGEKTAKWVVLGIFSIFIMLLFWKSISGTSLINPEEHVFYLEDSVLVNVILLGLFLAIGVFIKLKGKKIFPMPSKKAMQIITVVYVTLAAATVLILTIVPTADQSKVLACAGNLLERNYVEWQEGGYLFNYSNQNGIVLVFAALRLIFGPITWLAIQFLNIAALVICAHYCSKTMGILFKDEKLAAYSYIFLLFFLSMDCYITFVYGTIFGMAAVSSGIYNIIKYFESRKISKGIIGALLVNVSFIFKENYLIFIVAALLLFLCDGLLKRKWKSLALLAGGVVVCLIVNVSITVTIEAITDTEVSKGIPSKAWVAMGLQDGRRAPGWYNAYNIAVFTDNNYDYDVINKKIDEDIKKSLTHFKEDKQYARDFFGKKIASQWNEPTFQGLWILETRSKVFVWPETVAKIINQGNTLNNILLEICDFFLSFLWLGVILFIILGWKELDVYKLIYAIIFIGGFIFHLFWEGKAQYTVVYVYFMIPYMVRGYQMFFGRFTVFFSKKFINKQP